MKQLTALLLSFAGTVGVSVGPATNSSRASEPKEPPSTTLVVQVESSSNSTPTPDKGGAAPDVKAMDVPVYNPLPLVKYPKPRATNAFWEKMAQCETASDWKNRGRWAGGLGIMTTGKIGTSSWGTWEAFGGEEFAPSPDKATKEEQIIVANRISVEGYRTTINRDSEWAKRKGVPVSLEWVKAPVGFGGWGCLDNIGGKPALVAHSPETVITQQFKWGQKGRLVMDLQAIIGVRQDGKYGAKTWAAHARYVALHNISRVVLPNHRIKLPKVPADKTKRCPEYEELAYSAGFPAKEVDNVSYIMWKESRCKPQVVNTKEGTYGLMQIDDMWRSRLRRLGVIDSLDDLKNPETNLLAAFVVWTIAIEARGYGWHPWNLY